MRMSEVIGGIGDKKSNGGTQYYQQDRVYDVAEIAQCIPAQIPGGAYRILEIKEQRLGNVYNDEKFTGGNYGGNVWGSQGLAPTMKVGASASQQCVVEAKILDNLYAQREERVYDISPTLRSERTGLKVVETSVVAIDEQNMLTRTETVGTLTTDGSSPKHNNRVCEITKCVAERTRSNGEWIKGEKHEGNLEMREDECTNTITSVSKDNEVLLIRQATKDGAIPCKIGGVADLNYVGSTTRRGRVQGNGEICPALTTENIPSVLEPWIWEIDGVKYLIRIRKLTPRECWALMDFNEGAFDQAEKVNSNTQLYKQAGNSIVVNCLTAIIGQMLEGKEDVYKDI